MNRLFLAAGSVLGLCWLSGGDLPGLDKDVSLVVAIVSGLIVFGVVKSKMGKVAGGRMVEGHGHGSTRKLISIHEGGHYHAAKALGGSVISAQMSDHGGLVMARIPSDAVSGVAFLRVGQVAAGTARGSSADDAAIRRELRRVPSKDRGRVKADGYRLAKKISSSKRGAIRATARKLDAKGRL